MRGTAKYMDIFIDEAREHVQSLNQMLLSMEKDGYDEDCMNEGYRIVHTIKGTANVLGIGSISGLAHTMEDLFDSLRKEGRTPAKEMFEALFSSLDVIESMVNELAGQGTITTKGDEMALRLRFLMNGDGDDDPGEGRDKSSGVGDAAGEGSDGEGDEGVMELSAEQKAQVMEALEEGLHVFEVTAIIDRDMPFKEGRVFQMMRGLSAISHVIASTPDTGDIDDDVREVRVLLSTREPDDSVEAIVKDVSGVDECRTMSFNPSKAGMQRRDVDDGGKKGLSTSDTVRVKSRLLDHLLDLVGEIMISNIRMNKIAGDLGDRDLKLVMKNTERLTGELQDTVLNMRMVPVDHIFKRFPRMVRDMAHQGAKEIDFDIRGNDIEIDRSLLDNIGDSLVHLLRNAVDHGIEPTGERVASGKPARGSVILSAYREQSSIVITVKDDGRGMDPERILEKAVAAGVVAPEEVQGADKRTILSLAFTPGISTASEVTTVSGRGVGLDVVKSKVESLGGSVKLDTSPGEGTTVTMKLPPSMSIIRAMLVEINRERYAIPLENVKETVKIPRLDLHEVAASGMFRLREEVLPVFDIHRDFGGEPDDLGKELPAVLVEKDDARACLVVSRLIGQQEIVVKNLGKDLRSAECFSGATILGDGKVAMILDVGAFV